MELQPTANQATTSSTTSGDSNPRKPSREPDHHQQQRHFLTVQVGPAEVPDGAPITQALYTVSYRTDMPEFPGPEGSVKRSFAEFAELWCRLRERYGQFGVVLPARPPDRPLAEAARARLLGRNMAPVPAEAAGGGGDHAGGAGVSFADRRRARLTRFLARCVGHPSLRAGRELREFLSVQTAPAAADQPARGGLGVMRALATSIGESVASSFSFQGGGVDEAEDEWLDDCTQAIEDGVGRLNRLRGCLESVAGQRRAYAGTTGRLADSLGRLSGAESEPGLAALLGHLAESLTGLGRMQSAQADTEELELCDLLADQADGLAGERDCLAERGRSRRALAAAEAALTRRREGRVRAQLAGREASGPTPAELEQLEDEVEQRQAAFEAVTQAARRELARCERLRAAELRAAVAGCLRSQVEGARRLLAAWEALAPPLEADGEAEAEGGQPGTWVGGGNTVSL